MLILQPFRHFTYVTAHSPTLPPLYLRHSSFSNPPFASPTSQALHLRHLTSRLWIFAICQNVISFSLDSGLSQKTRQNRHRVYVRVCVCVCVCGKFWFLLTISKQVTRVIRKFCPYIVRTIQKLSNATNLVC